MGFCLTQNATGSSFVMKLQLGSIRKGCVIDLMGSLGFGTGILTSCWHLAVGIWLLASGCWHLAAGIWLLADFSGRKRYFSEQV